MRVPEIEAAVSPFIQAGVHAVAEDAEVVDGVHVCRYVSRLFVVFGMEKVLLLTGVTFAFVFEIYLCYS